MLRHPFLLACLVLYLPLPAAVAPSLLETTPALTPTSHTILHLFYVIQHLTPALALITRKTASSGHIESLCARRVVSFFKGTTILKSPHVQNVFCHIEQTASLQPLHHLWERVKQFKHGINPEEKTLLLDFSKLCLITFQSLLTTLDHKNSVYLPSITPEDLDSLEQINQVFEVMEKYSLSYFLNRSPLLLSVLPLGSHEFCASFALRFYLNKRLKAAFEFFSSFHEKKVPLFVNGLACLGFKKDDIVFDDQVIAGYFSLLQEEKHLAPLMKLIEQFRSFDFIKSPLFVKEFLMLLCITYKDLLFRNLISTRSTEIIEELHELSLEQLLAIIDVMNEKYVPRRECSPLPQAKVPFYKNRSYEFPTVAALIQEEYGVLPDTFTNLVFHRYYYVKRLDEVVKILLRYPVPPAPTKTSLPLKPLALVWEDFIAYKDICDQKLIDDFTKEIFILSQTMLHTPLHHQHTHILQSFLPKRDIADFLLKKSLSRERSTLMSDFKPAIEVNRVISRFYYVKRLEPVMTKIHALYTKELLFLGCNDCSCTADPCLQHLHREPLLTMLHNVSHTHSFKPVFTLWNNISRYKYIQDEGLEHEFAHFITHLVHSTATHHARANGAMASGRKSFLPLDQLHEMPLEDILNLLDVLVDELPDFLEKHEIHAGMNWKQWYKKYWLIGPLSIVAFAVRIYLLSQGKTHKEEGSLATPVSAPTQ